mgnify:CR=1 FL=1
MKAFVIQGKDQIAMEERPIPTYKDDEVLLKMKVCGICHSDYDLIKGEYIIPFTYPITPGHEWSAEVVEIGKNVKNVRPGDRVVGEANMGCGECPVCHEGGINVCPDAKHFGFQVNGADSEFFVQKAKYLHKIPETISDVNASFIETFTVAYYGIWNSGGLDGGDVAVIYGGGSVGGCAVAAAHGMGAYTICVEPVAFKREIMKKVGADLVLDPVTQDVPAEILKHTGGLGADMVVDCTGNAHAQTEALDVAKNSGRVVYIGINYDKSVPVELGKIQVKGLKVKGSNGSPFVWERAIRFLSQTKTDLSPLMTHQFPLSEAVEAFEFTKDPETPTIKVVLVNE